MVCNAGPLPVYVNTVRTPSSQPSQKQHTLHITHKTAWNGLGFTVQAHLRKLPDRGFSVIAFSDTPCNNGCF
jgi:hypothetical protein